MKDGCTCLQRQTMYSFLCSKGDTERSLQNVAHRYV